MAFAWKTAGISYVSLRVSPTSANSPHNDPHFTNNCKSCLPKCTPHDLHYTAKLVIIRHACARAVRNSLKEDLRVVAQRRDQNFLKYAKWENGKQGEVFRVRTTNLLDTERVRACPLLRNKSSRLTAKNKLRASACSLQSV
ncbi:hypothetical protein BC938DRAFT_474528 [Jimgerdemannia flammicorona]|uniref:Uncharacterized protein n=1 Tax=Jimgerdemannia flammicorona TaxID=994334 RepID=A0A433Q246_9FUNG|nr:hypothetical protein BC938DRAFT_474528 [Jimgerdemannia flammicorona]